QFMRRFYGNLGVVEGTTIKTLKTVKPIPAKLEPEPNAQTIDPIGLKPAQLLLVRDGIFAYVDHRCDAYIDAIFWANRTRGAATSANSAIAGATGAIVGATGGTATALAVIAAAFGLTGNLFDAYYESVLYQLEPSGIQSLVDGARDTYRTSDNLDNNITSEGMLLSQVQDYIRLCTPAYIEFLVNEAVKKAKIGEPDDKDKAGGGVPDPAAPTPPSTPEAAGDAAGPVTRKNSTNPRPQVVE
ncbi:MAG: hypothetical protein AAGI70_02075, partial [Pseudomonadota bacterium]